VVVYLVTTLLQTYSIQYAGEFFFENLSIFGEDMDKSLRLTFMGHRVNQRQTDGSVSTNSKSVMHRNRVQTAYTAR